MDVPQRGGIKEAQMGVRIRQARHQGRATAINNVCITGIYCVAARNSRDLVPVDQDGAVKRFCPRPVDHGNIGK